MSTAEGRFVAPQSRKSRSVMMSQGLTVSGELSLRSGENEFGYLWTAALRNGYLKGTTLPRLCRVCALPLYWRGVALVCSGKCDGVGSSSE